MQIELLKRRCGQVMFLTEENRPNDKIDFSENDDGSWATRELAEARHLMRAVLQRHRKRGLSELSVALLGGSRNGVFVARDVLAEDLWSCPAVLMHEPDAQRLEAVVLKAREEGAQATQLQLVCSSSVRQLLCADEVQNMLKQLAQVTQRDRMRSKRKQRIYESLASSRGLREQEG